jgi:DNA-binding MarR family transcriptional regulator
MNICLSLKKSKGVNIMTNKTDNTNVEQSVDNALEALNGLTEKEMAIVEALVNRDGETFEEIAEKVGMSVRHLFRYRQRPYIQNAVKELAVLKIKEMLPKAVRVLEKKVEQGHYRSIELVVRLNRLLEDKAEININVNNDSRFSTLSDEEIDKEISDIRKNLKVVAGGKK